MIENPLELYRSWKKQPIPRTPPNLRGLADYIQVSLEELEEIEKEEDARITQEKNEEGIQRDKLRREERAKIIKLEKEQQDKEREEIAKTYDSVKSLRLRQKEVDDALIRAALEGNVKAMELFSKRTGVYSDDKDAKKIDAGEMSNMLLEALKQLKKEGHTVK